MRTPLCKDDSRLALLKQYGIGSLAYSSLQDGLDYFMAEGIGFISYARSGFNNNAPICLGDPICAPSTRQLLLAFFSAGHKNAMFLHISKDTAETLQALGYYINEIGTETIIDVQNFDLSGSKKEFLRSQRNRARKDGIEVREITGQTSYIHTLKRISDEWMQNKATSDAELKFIARPAVYEDEVGVRKFVAFKDGKVMGFVFFDPMYKDGRITGYLANILRSNSNASYSVTDYIILQALDVFKEEGIQDLSLGFSPFYKVEDKGDFRYSKPLKKFFQMAFEHGNFMYSFKSLAFHKDRYRPDLPGARQIKVYGAARRALPAVTLYQVFLKMGMRPAHQAASAAGHVVQEKVKAQRTTVVSYLNRITHGSRQLVATPLTQECTP